MKQEIVNIVIDTIVSILERKNISYKVLDNGVNHESINWSIVYYVSPCDEDGDLTVVSEATHFLFDDYTGLDTAVYSLDEIDLLYELIENTKWN